MHPLIGPFEPLKIELFSLPGFGPLTIYSFGVLVAFGFWAGAEVARRRASAHKLDPEVINRLIGYLVLGTFVGGHLGHALMYEPEVYLKNPIELLKVWDGLSSYGGFVACTLLTWWFFRVRERVAFWPYADVVAYGLPLGWMFGRLGCFSVHDHAGTSTEFWLGVYGMCPDKPDTVACHDLGLYEAIYSGIMFGIFVFLGRKPRFSGFFVGWMAVLYGPLRLILDVFRHPDTDTRYLGFTPAQYLSVLVTLLGVAILLKRRGEDTPAAS
ncbi:MAG: prolipoprotein diacylglyceryl transferase [Deltaproteobacteria bacterium]|jgi:phosphatidylglycerol:prolipoprotein diacylglycerol transferase|nr:prolipoprotein diacylglyceryl transferase [Deltaproteobacteria bacterium]